MTPISCSSLIELLQYRAADQSDQTAYTFLQDGEIESDSLSYGQLFTQVQTIAAVLQKMSSPGERALLLFPSGLEFIKAFLGCLWAEIVAVPAYPPRRNQRLERLQAIVHDAQPRLILTTSDLLERVRSQCQAMGLMHVQCHAVETLLDTSLSQEISGTIDPETLAFLQYTSGSTGNPKGVMVSHGNLLHNCSLGQAAAGATVASHMVLWLPLFHDMGLLNGVLSPLYAGCPVTLMSPEAFLQKPLRWLQAISNYQGTISGAPDFAYQLCIKRIRPEQKADLDLSSWQVAFNGAEPIQAQTLDAFAAEFADCGFTASAWMPCYGLAEATLGVSWASLDAKPKRLVVPRIELASGSIERVNEPVDESTPATGPSSKILVSSGKAPAGWEIQIVDPETCQLLTDGKIGEIWVRGASVTQGYWQQAKQSQEIFEAYLKDGQNKDEGPYLRTGDLGFLNTDSDLFVTGRLKDIIIIRGRNYYPHDIELVAEESHPALRANSGAAFSVVLEDQERLIIIYEVERSYLRRLKVSEEVSEIAKAIRRSISNIFGLQVYNVVLLKPGGLPKTSSGKVRRLACRTDFLDHTLTIVSSDQLECLSPSSAHIPTEASNLIQRLGAVPVTERLVLLQQHLQSELQQILGLAQLPTLGSSFFDLGLDSVRALELQGNLQQQLGDDYTLPITLAFDYPTINKLTEYLADKIGIPSQKSKNKPTPRLFRSLDTDAIAIVGLACRFPGAVDKEAYWQLLIDQTDAITEVPPKRWDVDAYYDPNPNTSGKMTTRYGGFIQNIDQFDATFFGISPREAIELDPQQRLLLEVSWQALEDANIAPTNLVGSRTGVYVGISTNDYRQLIARSGEDAIGQYLGTGTSHSAAVGRISYSLGLEGPSVAIDTACSSSLVALHQARQGLLIGECDLALVGGVNAILTPETTIYFSRGKFMAPDGRCKTFDAAANGYVRGEGCGIVVLKRLSDAEQDHDFIYSIIRGSAVNQDGASGGLTVPNGPSQQRVIQTALGQAQMKPADVTYVEAHGTGTSLGDPIEVQALQNVFGSTRRGEAPLLVGSVKTNIGHLEAAAGIASLIKVALSLHQGTIPGQLHFKTPSPKIDWDSINVQVVDAPSPWPEGKRVAGVSGFAFQGTNAHVVLEAYNPQPATVSGASNKSGHYLLPLSGKQTQAVRDLANAYQSWLQNQDAVDLADVCFTAANGRSHFAYRAGLVAATKFELREALQQLATGRLAIIPRYQPPKVAFLFTGQGSQYINMGRELYETQPIFKQALDRCAAILIPYLDKPLLEVIYSSERDTSSINQTVYTQPALFAIEYALYQLWQSWGIHPTVVLGHSVGEYVAACVAGVFSLEDGLKLIAVRGKLMQQLPSGGGMVSLLTSVPEISSVIADYHDISIAAINGPQSAVISGPITTLQTVTMQLESRGIKSKVLQVSHGFHSSLMQPMVNEFEQVAQTVSYSSPQLKFISNVTGQLATQNIATAEYWCQHILATVNFVAGMEILQQEGCDIYVECGPTPFLIGMGRQCLPNDMRCWLPSLRPDKPDRQQILTSLSELYVHGAVIDWRSFNADYTQKCDVQLPYYPFQRERYWIDTTPKLVKTSIGATDNYLHPLLGKRIRLARNTQDIFFETTINGNYPSYLADHRILGQIVLPASAYIEMALAAGLQYFKSSHLILEDFSINQPLILTTTEDTTVQIVLSPADKSIYTVEIISLITDADGDEATWKVHAHGTLQADISRFEREHIELEAWRNQEPPDSLDGFYQKSQEHGLNFGPCFQTLQQAWLESSQGTAQLQLPADALASPHGYLLHPIMLDAGFQLAGAIWASNVLARADTLYLPISITRLELYSQTGTNLWVQVKNQDLDSSKRLNSDLLYTDPQGEVVAKIEGFKLQAINRQALQRSLHKQLDQRDWLYTVDWQIQTLDSLPCSKDLGCWLVFTSEGKIGQQLLTGLQQQEFTCVQISLGHSYQKLSDEHYQVNPMRPNDYQQVLNACLQKQGKLAGVIHLLSLDSSRGQKVDEPTSLIQKKQWLKQTQIHGCATVLHLLQSFPQAQDLSLFLITQGAQLISAYQSGVQFQQTSLWGLGRVIALEYPHLRCQCLDLDPYGTVESNVGAILTEVSATPGENQVAYRQNQRLVARLRPEHEIPTSKQQLSIPNNKPYQLTLSAYGSPEYLTLSPMQRRAPAAGEVEVKMQAVGLNFRDLLNTLGVLQDYYAKTLGITEASQLTFGFEGVGHITAVGAGVTHLQVGDAVMVVLITDAFRSYVTPSVDRVVKLPQNLSAIEAATLPLVFLTADYGLNQLSKLQPGERVLIHGAAGGVGQAAIQIAQQIGAEIYATASQGKWEFLRSQNIQHIFNSRTTEFAEQLMAVTHGQGVDVVLNSFNGEHIPKSLDVLAPGGRFIEMGKAGIWSRAQVEQKRPDVHYYPFDLGEVAQSHPDLIAKMLAKLQLYFEQQQLHPLKYQVYPIERIVDALRLMQQGQHIGKLVITLPDYTQPLHTLPIQPEGTYLITGGLGALGLEMAQWLVAHGACHLMLMGRHSPSPMAKQVIEQLIKQGTTVMVQQTDVANFDAVAQSLQNLGNEAPPLRGILHAAGVLHDGLLQHMQWSQFESVMAPKVSGTWNLHRLTQTQALDFFVCFSSIAAVLGNAGQGNYAAANAFMDALMQQRQYEGLPGLSIQWGPWERRGMAAELDVNLRTRLQQSGVQFITASDGRSILRQSLTKSSRNVAVMPIDWSKFVQSMPATPAFLAKCLPNKVETRPNSSLLDSLQPLPIDQRIPLLNQHLQGEVARVLGLTTPVSLSLNQPLSDLGLDSLMGFELNSRLAKSLQVSLPATLLADNPNIATLAAYLAQAISDPTAPSPDGVVTESMASTEAQPVTTVIEPVSLSQATTSNNQTPPLKKLFWKAGLKIFQSYCSFSCDGTDYLPQEQPYLIAANHMSHLDTIAIAAATSEFTSGMFALAAKDYFFDQSLKAWFFANSLNLIPLDRYGTFETCIPTCQAALKQNNTILIFPEGSRSQTGELQPFKPGIGLLAWELEVPVIPAYIMGTYQALPKGKRFPKRHPIHIKFGQPLHMSDYVTTNKFAKHDHYQMIADALYHAVKTLGEQIEP